MSKLSSPIVIAVFFILVSCQPTPTKTSTIEGFWQSIGYGKVLAINSGNYASYDITAISCLPEEEGKLSSFAKAPSLQNDTLVVTKGTSKYYYIRISELPNLCTQALSKEKANDPVYNFEVFARTVQEHFAYFKDSNINWDSLYKASKKRISENPTEVELYLVLDDMLNTLGDNHGYVEPSDEVYESAEQLQTKDDVEDADSTLEEYGDFQIAQIVAEAYLEEDMTKDSWLMSWGKMNDNIGYVQIKSMWLYADLNLSDSLIQADGFVDAYINTFTQMNEAAYIQEEVKGVKKVMDRVMNDLKDTESILLDIRFNGGGQDAVSREILRRFNDQQKRIATKKAIHGKGFTAIQSIYMAPATTPYLKPVYLLTSQQSASAADFMALASFEIPHLKRIGSHSNGALSDALEKHLPNGWYFTTSNEMYLDNNGVYYESRGIPVDSELNYPEDRQTFFRYIAKNLDKDKKDVLEAIKALQGE